MRAPKILVFAGSIRAGSFNARLAARAAKELTLLEAEVTRISLGDYPMPIYDGDLEAAQGPPAAAVKLKGLMSTQAGIFIATPEYNASVPPLLKNALDWVSRVRGHGEAPLAAFRNRAFAPGAASEPGSVAVWPGRSSVYPAGYGPVPAPPPAGAYLVRYQAASWRPGRSAVSMPSRNIRTRTTTYLLPSPERTPMRSLGS